MRDEILIGRERLIINQNSLARMTPRININPGINGLKRPMKAMRAVNVKTIFLKTKMSRIRKELFIITRCH